MASLSTLRCILLAAFVGAGPAAQLVGAQKPAAVTARAAHTFGVRGGMTAAQSESVSGPGAFLLEAAAGSLGSLAGIGLVGLTASCGVDDLGCVITKVGAGGALGAVGATIGTVVAARHTRAQRSGVGAAVGSVIGTGVGLGVHYLLNRASDRNLGDAGVVPIFVLSQGVFAAIGSRVFGGMR